MLTAPLPSQIDIRKWVVKGADISAEVPLSSLPRIADLLADSGGSIAVQLHFYVDEERFRRVDGHVKGSVKLTCQRCLEPMAVNVDCEFQLAIVWSEERAQGLPKRLEPLIVGEELVDLADVVSDELILSLPYVNYHDPADCSMSVGYESSDPGIKDKVVVDDARENPFQVLEKLKFDK